MTLRYKPTVTYAAGTQPFSIATGHFNGDARADLAVTNLNSGTVSVLTNDGSGGFGVATSYAAGSNPGSVAAGDLNGDGRADLVVGNRGSLGGPGAIGVYISNGDGTFGEPTTHATGNILYDVAIGRLNGDSSPDIA